jgi:hypothetical protein
MIEIDMKRERMNDLINMIKQLDFLKRKRYMVVEIIIIKRQIP